MSHPGLTCRVCGSQMTYLWHARLLERDVAYGECPRCRYIQTEEPTWLEEAYASPINLTDTGILGRNQGCFERVVMTLRLLGNVHGRVKDLAGGFGILVRMLRDAGVDAWWADKYAQNVVARGFEDDGQRAVLATSFEAFEHFVHPMDELGAMLADADSLLISTQLAPEPTPAASAWWYYGLEHGQHIGFFRRSTLEYMAQQHGMRLLSDDSSFHLFTRAPVREFVWRQALKRRKRFLKWARSGLQSKTWSDHELLKASMQSGDAHQ